MKFRLLTRAFLAIFILLAGFAPAVFAAAQPSVGVEDKGVTIAFGESVTFKAGLTGDLSEISEALLFVTPQGEKTIAYPLEYDHAGRVSQSLPLDRLHLRPFTENSYRFQLVLTDRQTLSSESAVFDYEDTRFDWQSQSEQGITAHWYDRPARFGQSVLNISQEGLDHAQTFLPSERPAHVDVYVYNTAQDLQSAINLSDQTWIAGHAAPDLGMIMISIPNGMEEMLELERQVPHEMMHILQYQLLGEDFRRQPLWLLEGMASLSELYPNSEYARVLSVSGRSLLPMQSLCDIFPREAAGAFLAYAQSESFVHYIYDRNGSAGLMRLMDQYRNGYSCSDGYAATFNMSLGMAEVRWKQEVLGIDTGSLVLWNLSPYLLLLLILLIPAFVFLTPYSRPALKPEATNAPVR